MGKIRIADVSCISWLTGTFCVRSIDNLTKDLIMYNISSALEKTFTPTASAISFSIILVSGLESAKHPIVATLKQREIHPRIGTRTDFSMGIVENERAK